jgi:transcriptional/translational regulatory protein YebC/TACO1
MVECLTDNPNRTAPNMRVCFRKGQMTPWPGTLTMWA